jgi:hypothetical protein
MGYDYDTSLPAYNENPNGKDYCRQMVLITIRKLGVCNDRQIAEQLQWPINRITPRRGELVESGQVMSSGKRLDPQTGRHVNYWQVSVRFAQMTLF